MCLSSNEIAKKPGSKLVSMLLTPDGTQDAEDKNRELEVTAQGWTGASWLRFQVVGVIIQSKRQELGMRLLQSAAA